MRLTPFESLLKRNIAASAAARALCKRLEGKVLALRLEGLPLTIHMQARTDDVALATDALGEPDATLSGTPLSFLRLAGTQPETALRAGAVHIEGDAEVAHGFSELLKQARPDLEEELSRIVGDVAAHQIGNLARSMLDFGRRAQTTLAQNVAEYLQEEGRDVPTRTEADEFIAGVDRLRDDVDRLEASLRLTKPRGPQ
jgi:ubiquinone biosynthesis accessory factor UbiJ